MNLNNKKTGLILLSVFMMAFCVSFAGCSKNESAGGISKTGISGFNSVSKNDSLKKIKVVATVYPFYEWAKAVAGDAADVELLINSGTDLHNFTPSAKDIIKVTGNETDLFIYGGGESDFWIEKLLPKMNANGVAPLNLMEVNKEILISEEEHHHHDEEHCENCEHEHGAATDDTDCTDDCEEMEFDEHIWMSVKKASAFVDSICKKMCEADAENGGIYRKNAENYKAKLDEIAGKFAAVTAETVRQETSELISDKTVIIADRNPFTYLAEDFGLNIVAAFHGCSAETEASFETIMKLSHEADEHNVKAIVITETGNDKIAKTVIENCKNKDLKILTLNAMQGKMKEDQTYLSVMEDNLKVIEELLK